MFEKAQSSSARAGKETDHEVIHVLQHKVYQTSIKKYVFIAINIIVCNTVDNISVCL